MYILKKAFIHNKLYMIPFHSRTTEIHFYINSVRYCSISVVKTLSVLWRLIFIVKSSEFQRLTRKSLECNLHIQKFVTLVSFFKLTFKRFDLLLIHIQSTQITLYNVKMSVCFASHHTLNCNSKVIRYLFRIHTEVLREQFSKQYPLKEKLWSNKN